MTFKPLKRKTPFALVLIWCCPALLSCGACGNGQERQNAFPDGYYTAETADFDAYGWKEFLSIYINNGRIVSVEYNAKNSSGFIKSWDHDYMRLMNAADGTYPNEYTRIYAAALLNRQNPKSIDAISGATASFQVFQLLAEAVLKQARAGAKEVALVELPPEAMEENPPGELSGTP
ncbi:MAG: FMN-binding protein [Treponema sp.]|nr:FMN-binding protein [Treponema sp.]